MLPVIVVCMTVAPADFRDFTLPAKDTVPSHLKLHMEIIALSEIVNDKILQLEAYAAQGGSVLERKPLGRSNTMPSESWEPCI